MKKIASSVGFVAGGLAAATLPIVAFAQNAGQVGSGIFGQATQVTQAAGNLASWINSTLNVVIAALITLAVVVFIFNVIRFLLAKDPETQKASRKYLFWSVIAIAVVIGIFGLARLLLATLGINGGGLQSQEVPQVPVYHQ